MTVCTTFTILDLLLFNLPNIVIQTKNQAAFYGSNNRWFRENSVENKRIYWVLLFVLNSKQE